MYRLAWRCRHARMLDVTAVLALTAVTAAITAVITAPYLAATPEPPLPRQKQRESYRPP
jgi:hypothetical protein